MIKLLTETILGVLGAILAAILWVLSMKSQAKEKQRDEKTIAKIAEKYSGDDISAPVNDLIARLNRKN